MTVGARVVPGLALLVQRRVALGMKPLPVTMSQKLPSPTVMLPGLTEAICGVGLVAAIGTAKSLDLTGGVADG
jgi:hypothetical protein